MDQKTAFQTLEKGAKSSRSQGFDIAQLTNKPRKKRIRVAKKTLLDSEGQAVLYQKPYQHINWMTLLLWPAIDHAAKITNFSARSLVKVLQRQDR